MCEGRKLITAVKNARFLAAATAISYFLAAGAV
jgi:hypothetical protein